MSHVRVPLRMDELSLSQLEAREHYLGAYVIVLADYHSRRPLLALVVGVDLWYGTAVLRGVCLEFPDGRRASLSGHEVWRVADQAEASLRFAVERARTGGV